MEELFLVETFVKSVDINASQQEDAPKSITVRVNFCEIIRFFVKESDPVVDEEEGDLNHYAFDKGLSLLFYKQRDELHEAIEKNRLTFVVLDSSECNPLATAKFQLSSEITEIPNRDDSREPTPVATEKTVVLFDNKSAEIGKLSFVVRIMSLGSKVAACFGGSVNNHCEYLLTSEIAKPKEKQEEKKKKEIGGKVQTEFTICSECKVCLKDEGAKPCFVCQIKKLTVQQPKKYNNECEHRRHHQRTDSQRSASTPHLHSCNKRADKNENYFLNSNCIDFCETCKGVVIFGRNGLDRQSFCNGCVQQQRESAMLLSKKNSSHSFAKRFNRC